MIKAESKPAVNKHNALKNGSSFFKGNDSMLSAENQEDIQPFFNGTSTIQTKSDTSLIRAKPFFQPKLTVGKPNDKYEIEADAMADKVVQRLAENQSNERTNLKVSTSPSIIRKKCAACAKEEKLQKKEGDKNQLNQVEQKLQRKPIFEIDQSANESTVQRNSDLFQSFSAIQKQESESEEETIQEKEEEQNYEKVQRKPIFDSDASADLQTKSNNAPNFANVNLENRLNSSKGGGSPLPEETQTSMGSAFGADFSGVRIHTDSNAVQMNKELNAQAFTRGNDIYFNEGKYDDVSSVGQRLLAHELTHTVQQGATPIQTKLQSVSTTSLPIIQRKSWIRRKIESGLNWAAERLVPGYSLLNVILGKNLITDDPVPRTGENIIRGYMRLLPVIGSILLNELEETNTLKEAGIWVKGKVEQFGIDFDDIANRLRIMWDEMSVWNGIDGNIKIFKKYIGPVLGKFLAFSSVVQEKVKELRFEGALLLVGATKLLAAMKKDPKAFKRLVDNPKLILKHFMDAIKKGFLQFKDNFGKHFKNALFGWLFGKAAEMGVEIPKKFDVAGLFHLIAQLVGATYQQIRAMVVKRLGPKGELIISKLEQSFEVVKDLVTNGPIALWNRVKDFLKNLKEMFFSAISSLVTSEIIKTAVAKLVSMLNPVGAIVQLVLTLYRVIRYFIDWWETIKEIATGILNTITNVALGKIGQAANFIENIMGKGMKLIIAFLARIFGLGGIAAKVKKLIKKIADPVKKAIGKVISWIVNKGKKLFSKILSKGKKAGNDKRASKQKSSDLNKAVEEGTKQLKANKNDLPKVEKQLLLIKKKYKLTTLKIENEGPQENSKVHILGVINPTKKGTTVEIESGRVLATSTNKKNAFTQMAKIKVSNVGDGIDQPTLDRYKNDPTGGDSYTKYLSTKKAKDVMDWPLTYIKRRWAFKKGKMTEENWIKKKFPGQDKNNEVYEVDHVNSEGKNAITPVIPDYITSSDIGDVKNVKSQSFTNQLRAIEQLAKDEGKKFSLIIRGKKHPEGQTNLSGPLNTAAKRKYRIITE